MVYICCVQLIGRSANYPNTFVLANYFWQLWLAVTPIMKYLLCVKYLVLRLTIFSYFWNSNQAVDILIFKSNLYCSWWFIQTFVLRFSLFRFLLYEKYIHAINNTLLLFMLIFCGTKIGHWMRCSCLTCFLGIKFKRLYQHLYLTSDFFSPKTLKYNIL